MLVGDCLKTEFGARPHGAGRLARDAAKNTDQCDDIHVPVPRSWTGVAGAVLGDHAHIRLRIAGAPGGPVIGVLGGISASRIVADHESASGRREAGWWRAIVGAGRSVDLNRYRVASIDFVADDDRHIPITTADQAGLFAMALDAAGVRHLDALIGASFGGMVALSLARQRPDLVSRIAIVCAAHRPSPMAQALRATQRRVLDLAASRGAPQEGVKLAREIAMISYRSAAELNGRFSCVDGPDGGVAAYLRARGEAYATRTSAARYLSLSGAIDRHFERPEAIATPALLIGCDSDLIAPPDDIDDLAARLAGPVERVSLSSVYGHDAFLKETAAIGPLLHNFLLKE